MPELREILYKAMPIARCSAAAAMWLSRPGGYRILPCQEGTKKFCKGYGPHLASLASLASLDQAEYLLEQRNLNIAILVPRGTVILDFDDIGIFAAFSAAWPDLRTYCESTPAGGRHLFLSLRDGAELVVPGLIRGLELKSCVLVAPSVVSGIPYQVIDTAPIASVTRERLLAALQPFSRLNQPARAGLQDVLEGKYTSSLRSARLSGSQGAFRGNSRLIAEARRLWPILPFMTFFAPGVKLSGSGRWRHGCCPWHHDVLPSLWLDTELGVWGCFAGCCGGGDVVTWFAMAKGVSLGKAAQQLIIYAGSVKVGM